MFGKEYKAALKAYREIIDVLQKEKTELHNRLLARNLQELQVVQQAFPAEPTVNMHYPSAKGIATADEDFMVGEVGIESSASGIDNETS